MGYESKIYIVDKSDHSLIGNRDKRYAEVISIFNMSKMGDFHNIFTKQTDCYIYSDDGTEIIRDRYNAHLTEASIEDVINYLDCFKKTEEHYRRIDPLLNMLKGFNKDEWKELVVLHYGY